MSIDEFKDDADFDEIFDRWHYVAIDGTQCLWTNVPLNEARMYIAYMGDRYIPFRFWSFATDVDAIRAALTRWCAANGGKFIIDLPGDVAISEEVALAECAIFFDKPARQEASPLDQAA